MRNLVTAKKNESTLVALAPSAYTNKGTKISSNTTWEHGHHTINEKYNKNGNQTLTQILA
jgi:hypothetical protein